MGSGRGVTACHLAENYGCSVIGVDMSENMIEYASEMAKRRGLVPRRATFAAFCGPGTPFAAFSASTHLPVRLRCAGLGIDIGSTRQLDSDERAGSIRVDQAFLPRHRHPERYRPRHQMRR